MKKTEIESLNPLSERGEENDEEDNYVNSLPLLPAPTTLILAHPPLTELY